MKKFEIIAAILVTAFDVNASAYSYERPFYRSGDRHFHSEEPAAAAVDTTGNIDDTLRAFVIGQGERREWHILRIVETIKGLAQINGVNLTINVDLEESLFMLYPIALETLKEEDMSNLPGDISPILSDDDDE